MRELGGRSTELGQVMGVAASPVEGALIVVGSTGSGKSALLEQAASSSPIPSVIVRINAGEAQWPLSGFTSFFTAFNDSRAAEFGGRFTLRSTEDGQLFAAARDLLSLLRGLDLDPILILVDDIDRMDEPSKALLGYMSARLSGTGLRIVATATSLERGGPLGTVPSITLGMLGKSDAAAIARGLAGPSADEGTLNIIATHSSGLPLAVIDIVGRATVDQLHGAVPLTIPLRIDRRLQAAQLESVEDLDPGSRDVLGLMALAPVCDTRVLEGEGVVVADALEDLENRGLIVHTGPYLRIRDPLLRSAVWWQMAPKERREAHTLLARRYRDLGEKLADWHVSFTGNDGSTVDALLGLAVHCAAEGIPCAAVEMADRAILLANGGGEQHDRVLELVREFFLAGEFDQAARYLVRGRNVNDGPAKVRLLTMQILIEYVTSHQILQHDIATWASIYADVRGAAVVTMLATAACLHANRWESSTAAALLERCDALEPGWALGEIDEDTTSYPGEGSVPFLREVAAIMVDAVEGRDIGGSVVLDDLSAAALVELPSAILLGLARGLELAERYVDARRCCTVILRRPTADQPLLTDLAHYVLVDSEFRSGNLHRAAAAMEDWHAVAKTLLLSGSPITLLEAWAAFADGDIEKAGRFCEAAHSQAQTERNRSISGQLFALQGSIALSAGDAEEAVRLLEQAAAAATPFANPALVRHAVDLIEAYTMIGKLPEAIEACDALGVVYSERPTRWLTLALGRARALVASDEATAELFQAAIAAFGPEDSAFERAKTLESYSRRLVRLGFDHDAAKAHTAAMTEFGHAGAQVWARAAQNQAGMVGQHMQRAALHLLTEAELVIAQMVRQGYRNKEIADALFVSLRTVELRLTHIYRKVGARSRSHLAALLL